MEPLYLEFFSKTVTCNRSDFSTRNPQQVLQHIIINMYKHLITFYFVIYLSDFYQTKENCSSQGSAVTFLWCIGKIRNFLRQISSGFCFPKSYNWFIFHRTTVEKLNEHNRQE